MEARGSRSRSRGRSGSRPRSRSRTRERSRGRSRERPRERSRERSRGRSRERSRARGRRSRRRSRASTPEPTRVDEGGSWHTQHAYLCEAHCNALFHESYEGVPNCDLINLKRASLKQKGKETHDCSEFKKVPQYCTACVALKRKDDGKLKAELGNAWLCWDKNCRNKPCPHARLVHFCGVCNACRGAIPAVPA